MKYVSPYFSKGQKIEYDSKRRSYRSNSYTPEGTPLEMEIDTYNIIKTSAGRKGVIEFTDGTRDYYTNIDIYSIRAKKQI